MISVGRLDARDRAAWQELFAGCHAFYGRPGWPQENYDQAWRAGPVPGAAEIRWPTTGGR